MNRTPKAFAIASALIFLLAAGTGSPARAGDPVSIVGNVTVDDPVRGQQTVVTRLRNDSDERRRVTINAGGVPYSVEIAPRSEGDVAIDTSHMTGRGRYELGIRSKPAPKSALEFHEDALRRRGLR